MFPAAAPAASPQVRCPTCGRATDCTPADLRVYAAIGPPRCCGKPMTLPARRPQLAGRTADRRPARPGTRVDVRRVGAAGGDDLGAGLVDVWPDGAGVRLTAPVTVGETLQVTLVRRDGRVAVQVPAAVQWCRPVGGGLHAAGVGFNRPLGLTELADLI